MVSGSTAQQVDQLFECAREYVPEDMFEQIVAAYSYAEKAHEGQVRKSGEPFIEHPLQTALFLAELKMDPNTLVAALLHDVLEDCDVEFEELEDKFGTEVAQLVDGVTKLTQTEAEHETIGGPGLRMGEDHDPVQAASIRKMLVAMAEDIRVVFIKLADRLHNMRTLKAMPAHRQIAIAQETLDIYAPLAHRLGIWEIKWRLEDLAFQYINPHAYKEISGLLNFKRAEREEYLEKVKEVLKTELENAGIQAEVTGRPKHIYSIHNKIAKYAEQGKDFNEIYDLFALRVLVNELSDCYAAVGVVHGKWRPIPGQFDDYIGSSKDNMYQSLHTTVQCEEAHPVEVQIRTYEMHRVSEYGVAAHWLYKEGKPVDAIFDQKMTWLRQLIEWQKDVTGAEEFLESVKSDVFESQVFVYTPRGDLIELPSGATPLDFAYRVHSDIGNSCIGAKVNTKLVPLHYKLQNGDTIDIMTSKTVRGPSLDWLNVNLGYIGTNSARTKIRHWFNRQERRLNIVQGREIFQKNAKRLNIHQTETELSKFLKFDSVDDFFASLGNGGIEISQVVSRLENQDIEEDQLPKFSLPKTGPGSGVQVLGVGDLLTRMGSCCQPVEGDEIIGYITRSRGVTVHRKGCPNVLAETERERLVPVNWGQTQTLYPVRIKVEAWDRVGLLRDVTALVSAERVNIAECQSEEFGDTSVISLTVYPNGLNQLDRVFSKLEGVKGVIGVTRASS